MTNSEKARLVFAIVVTALSTVALYEASKIFYESLPSCKIGDVDTTKRPSALLAESITPSGTHFRITNASKDFQNYGYFVIDAGHPSEELIHCNVVTNEIMAECTRGLDPKDLTHASSYFAYFHFLPHGLIRPLPSTDSRFDRINALGGFIELDLKKDIE